MSLILDHLKLTHEPFKDYIDNLNQNILMDIEPLHCSQFQFFGLEERDFCMDLFFQTQRLKESCMALGHYVLLTPRLIKGLSRFLQGKRCLEIMSGTGMLAHHLNKNGIDVIPTDDKSWQLDTKCPHHFPVHELSAIDAIKKFRHHTDVLLLCWPYMDNNAYQAIKEWGTKKPILVCLEMGGCCADKDFQSAFVGEVVDVGHQQMAYVHDHFYWGHYKPID